MKKIIVIVENNDTLTRIIDYRLKADGYNVKVFNNGEDAVRFMKDNPFDLLITRIYLPKMNGIEIIKTVRHKISEFAPIIAISNFNKEDFTEKIILSGINDFLVKPFRAGELCMHIKSLLKEKPMEVMAISSSNSIVEKNESFRI